MVIDVHTHMLSHEWVNLLSRHGAPRYSIETVKGGLKAIHLDGAPFMTPVPEMFDWEKRITNMTKAGVDLAVVSLTCPNVFWGGAEISLQAARLMRRRSSGPGASAGLPRCPGSIKNRQSRNWRGPARTVRWASWFSPTSMASL